MGFAKYNEDIQSRYVNDNLKTRLSGAQPAKAAKKEPAKAARPEPAPVPGLREFTAQTARALPVLFLADVSGSMDADGKINALNHSIREMLESFRDETDLRAEIHVGVVTFGGTVKVHMPLRPARECSWSDLKPSGKTPMGGAIELARTIIEDPATVSMRAYVPLIVLLSDGQPTDEWKAPLAGLLASQQRVFRMALGIGADADQSVLQAFLNDSKARVYRADDARQIRKFIQLVTMSVTARSRSANPNTAPDIGEMEWDL